jgi:acyl carrier protein
MQRTGILATSSWKLYTEVLQPKLRRGRIATIPQLPIMEKHGPHMKKEDRFEKISAIIARIASEKGLPAQPVAENTVILSSGLGIDSLDLAAIVIELSEATGKDPFQNGFIEFRTIGELCDLYGDGQGA